MAENLSNKPQEKQNAPKKAPEQTPTGKKLDNLSNEAAYAAMKARERSAQAKQMDRASNFRVSFFDKLANDTTKTAEEREKFKNLALRSRGIRSEHAALAKNAYRTEKAIAAQRAAVDTSANEQDRQRKMASINQLSVGEAGKADTAIKRAMVKSEFLRTNKNISPESQVVREEFSHLDKDVQDRILDENTGRDAVTYAQADMYTDRDSLESRTAQKEAIIYKAQNPDSEAKISLGNMEYIIDPDTGVIHTNDGRHVTDEKVLGQIEEEMGKRADAAEKEGKQAYSKWNRFISKIDPDIIPEDMRSLVQEMVIKMHSPFLSTEQRADLEKQYDTFARELRIKMSGLMSEKYMKDAEGYNEEARQIMKQLLLDIALTLVPMGRIASAIGGVAKVGKGLAGAAGNRVLTPLFSMTPEIVQRLLLATKSLPAGLAAKVAPYLKAFNEMAPVNNAAKNLTTAAGAKLSGLTPSWAAKTGSFTKNAAGWTGSKFRNLSEWGGNKLTGVGANNSTKAVPSESIGLLFNKAKSPELAALKSKVANLQAEITNATTAGKNLEAMNLLKRVENLYAKNPELKILDLSDADAKILHNYWQYKNFLQNPVATPGRTVDPAAIRTAMEGIEKQHPQLVHMLDVGDFHLATRALRAKLNLPKNVKELLVNADSPVMEASKRLKAIAAELPTLANNPKEYAKRLLEQKILNQKYGSLLQIAGADDASRTALQQYLLAGQRLERAQKLRNTAEITRLQNQIGTLETKYPALQTMLQALEKGQSTMVNILAATPRGYAIAHTLDVTYPDDSE